MKTTAEGEKLLAAITARTGEPDEMHRFRTATGLYSVRTKNLEWFADQVRKKFTKARHRTKSTARGEPSMAALIGFIPPTPKEEVENVTYEKGLEDDLKAHLLTLLRTNPMGDKQEKQAHASKIRATAGMIEKIQRKGVEEGLRAYTDLDLYYQPELAENL